MGLIVLRLKCFTETAPRRQVIAAGLALMKSQTYRRSHFGSALTARTPVSSRSAESSLV